MKFRASLTIATLAVLAGHVPAHATVNCTAISDSIMIGGELIADQEFDQKGAPRMAYNKRNPSGVPQLWVWLMNGSTIAGGGSLGFMDSNYFIANCGDFNNDGRSDVIWRNPSTGQVDVWLLNGSTVIGNGVLTHLPAEWTIAPR